MITQKGKPHIKINFLKWSGPLGPPREVILLTEFNLLQLSQAVSYLSSSISFDHKPNKISLQYFPTVSVS